MTSYSAPFVRLTDDTLHSFGPQFGNRIIHSCLTHIEKKKVMSDLSLKAVLSGTEMYRVDGRTYSVKEGSYLLVNKGQEVDCWFRSQDVTEGLCVYLEEELIHDVLRVSSGTLEDLLNDPFGVSHEVPDFFDREYRFDSNRAGLALQDLGMRIRKAVSPALLGTEDVFYWLAEELVQSQTEYMRQAAALSAGKSSTRRELFRRLLDAREMIDARFREDLSLEEISRASALSMYHMLRNFREAFGITPHQYLLRRRLDHARQMLETGSCRVSEAAHHSGFGDLHNFSKAFRKSFGVSPRKFMREAS